MLRSAEHALYVCAHPPGMFSQWGGGGLSGTPGHQLEVDGAGAGAAVGCCALAFAPTNVATTDARIAVAIDFRALIRFPFA